MGIKAAEINNVKKVCCITGCNEKGLYQPYFRVKDPRTSELLPHPAIEMFLQCLVCGSHRHQLTIGAVMTDNMWSHICGVVRGFRGVDPNHSDVSLEFKAEDSLITIFGKRFSNDS